ncbi:MAG: metallophosphoesterase [Myxococcota bacterium]
MEPDGYPGPEAGSERELGALPQAAPTSASLARLLPFVLVATTISTLIHLYLASRLATWPAWPAPVGAIVSGVVWTGAVMLPLGLGLWRFIGRERARVATWVGLTWMGAMYYLFAGLLVFELVHLALPASAGTEVARVAAIAVAALTLAVVVIGLARVRRGPIIAEVTVPVPDLPAALDGLRIAHLSDIHVGPTVDGRQLADIVARTRELRPDLVAITGDLMDGSVAALASDVAVLAELDPPLGVFFTTGNHEYYSGHEAWLTHLGTLGVRVLRNARVRVAHGAGSLDIAGVPDLQGARFGDAPDLERALAGRDDDDPTPLVVLAHQPKQALAAAARGATLVLSGHTHAGQLAPFGYLAKIGQPSIRGLFALTSPRGPRQSWLYTSEGTGYWGPPMRIGTRSEIALLTLVRA